MNSQIAVHTRQLYEYSVGLFLMRYTPQNIYSENVENSESRVGHEADNEFFLIESQTCQHLTTDLITVNTRQFCLRTGLFDEYRAKKFPAAKIFPPP